jgi:hypothetical protein
MVLPQTSVHIPWFVAVSNLYVSLTPQSPQFPLVPPIVAEPNAFHITPRVGSQAIA